MNLDKFIERVKKYVTFQYYGQGGMLGDDEQIDFRNVSPTATYVFSDVGYMGEEIIAWLQEHNAGMIDIVAEDAFRNNMKTITLKFRSVV